MDEEVVPVLRVEGAARAVAWYARLGFVEEWRHQFEPGFPWFVSVARGSVRLYLSEHAGDARPDTLIHLYVSDIDAVSEEFGIPVDEDGLAGRECDLVDPDGNRLRVATRRSATSSDAAATLETFGALIGAWVTSATHPAFVGVVPGRSTFAWLEGRRFIVQRTHNEHEMFPDSISVIGPPEDGGGLVMEYFDSRGVRRTYAVALEEGVLRIWRSAPGFDQRYAATLDAEAFDGVWQVAETPGEWRDDLKVTYRRAG